jgi:hypothetical protein
VWWKIGVSQAIIEAQQNNKVLKFPSRQTPSFLLGLGASPADLRKHLSEWPLFVTFDNPNPQLRTGQEGPEKTNAGSESQAVPCDFLEGSYCKVMAITISSNDAALLPKRLHHLTCSVRSEIYPLDLPSQSHILGTPRWQAIRRGQQFWLLLGYWRLLRLSHSAPVCTLDSSTYIKVAGTTGL